METNQYLINHYSSFNEDARLMSKHGSVEFLTTMRYIDKYIKPDDRVLEIGAGTGRYSHALAHQGYAVDAVELVEHNIEMFRKNIQPDETITVTQGNALDLSDFSDSQYDITLLPLRRIRQRTLPRLRARLLRRPRLRADILS